MKTFIQILKEQDMPDYHSAEYYDKQGGHGEIGNWPNFKVAFNKAMDLLKREKKAGNLGSSTGYIGVAGNTDQFAIMYVDQDYLDVTSQMDFQDKKAYNEWMKVAKKVLKTGKPMSGNYGLSEKEQFNRKKILAEAKYTIYKDKNKKGQITYTVYQGNKMIGQFLGDEPEFKKIKAQGEMKPGIEEKANGKLFVFASWENGVLKWRTEDNRTGSDPMKKKPSEADLMKLFKKRFKKEIDLDFRKD